MAKQVRCRSTYGFHSSPRADFHGAGSPMPPKSKKREQLEKEQKVRAEKRERERQEREKKEKERQEKEEQEQASF